MVTMRSSLPVWLFSGLQKFFRPTDQNNRAYETFLPSVAACSEDERFWWENTAPILARMMECSQYDVHDQYFCLILYFQFVLPALGPRPSVATEPVWRSFMTDDFSPIEYSWNFTRCRRTVRFVIEPISALAGTPQDPYNQTAPRRFLRRIPPVAAEMDLQWFNAFANEFYVHSTDNMDSIRTKLPPGEHASQAFVGFDLDPGRVSAKVYMMPVVKAAELGIQSGELVAKALQKIDLGLQGQKLSFMPAWNIVWEYIHSFTEESMTPRVEFVSFDCVRPQASRIKVYVRSPQMSLAVAKDMFVLGGRLGSKSNNEALIVLEELWRLSLGVSDVPEDEEVPPRDNSHENHRTGGVIFNYELRPGSCIPEPKLYIPVRHYAHSDQTIASGLASFFRRQGWKEYADTYWKHLQHIFPHHPLNERTGTQTYISFAYKKVQGPYVSVYYSPRIYER